MGTTGMAIFDLEFLNKSARGFICQACGFVHMFAGPDARADRRSSGRACLG